MAVAWFREVFEKARLDELDQLRRDCRAIDHHAELAARVDWRAALPAIQSATRLVTGEMPDPPQSSPEGNSEAPAGAGHRAVFTGHS
jgi:hypothetical protein